MKMLPPISNMHKNITYRYFTNLYYCKNYLNNKSSNEVMKENVGNFMSKKITNNPDDVDNGFDFINGQPTIRHICTMRRCKYDRCR